MPETLNNHEQQTDNEAAFSELAEMPEFDLERAQENLEQAQENPEQEVAQAEDATERKRGGIFERFEQVRRNRQLGKFALLADEVSRGNERAKTRMQRNIELGKYDFTDERVAGIYLSTVKDASPAELRNLEDAGISREQIFSNEHIRDLTVQAFRREVESLLVDDEDAEKRRANISIWGRLSHAPEGYSNEVLTSVLEDDEARDRAVAGLDIQRYGEVVVEGAHDLALETLDKKDLAHATENIAILKKMGYEPFREDASLDRLLVGNVHVARRQEIANGIGLIDETIVDRMYQRRLDMFMDWLEFSDEEPTEKPEWFSVDLIPSEDNTMARYWREQSMVLGVDAMSWVMTKIATMYDSKHEDWERNPQWHSEDDEPALEDYIVDGVLQDAFFDGSAMYSPMHDMRYCFYEGRSGNYHDGTMRFLGQNIDRLHGADRGLVETCMKINAGDGNEIETETARWYFMQMATGGHNMEAGIFDENGITDTFYDYALTCSDGKELNTFMPYIDENWLEHFTTGEQSFLKFCAKYPNFMIHNYYGTGKTARQAINEFFDEDGASSEFATVMLEKHGMDLLTYPEVRVRLSDEQRGEFVDELFGRNPKKILDCPDLLGEVSETELAYLQYMKSHSSLDADLSRTEIAEMFDEDGPNETYLAYLLEKSPDRFLLCDDMREKLSEEQMDELAGKLFEASPDSLWRYPDVLARLTKEQQERVHLLIAGSGRYTPEEGEFAQITDENAYVALSRFMWLDAQDWERTTPGDAGLREAFMTTETKNLVLGKMRDDYRRFLSAGNPEAFPLELKSLVDVMIRNEGAGPLTQMESFMKFLNAFESEGNGTQLMDAARRLEGRFDREHWSDEDRSNFYDVSAEVIMASPDIYEEFADLMTSTELKKGEFRTFAKEIYPLFRAKLSLIGDRKELNGNGVGRGYVINDYSAVDKEALKNQLHTALLPFSLHELSPEKREEGISRVKANIFGEITELFQGKFGILPDAIPQEFSKEDTRAIEDMTLYLSNINNPNEQRQNLIGLYLALSMGGAKGWEGLRRGESVEAGTYLTPEVSSSVGRAIAESRANDPISLENTGIASEAELTAFRGALQHETTRMRLGNTQTIDMRVQDLMGNIADLEDLDLYPNPMDRAKLDLLEQYTPKEIGRVSTELWKAVSGKRANFAEGDEALRDGLNRILSDNGLEVTPENIKTHLQQGFRLLRLPSDVRAMGVESEISELRGALEPGQEIMSIFNRFGEGFTPQSGAMALSADLENLENIANKHEDELTEEERAAVGQYLGQIKERMTVLEASYEEIKEKLAKAAKALEGDISGTLEEVKKKMEEIRDITEREGRESVITTVCTGSLVTIIENMRMCLSCKTKGCNNDTDLTFGEGYKFYLYSHSDSDPNGSISDEIVYFVPTENQGERRMTFVMDLIYGRKTQDIMVNHVQTMVDKARELKRQYPEVPISILVPFTTSNGATMDADTLMASLELTDEGGSEVQCLGAQSMTANIPKSGFGDHYIEFGEGSARTAGARKVSGVEVRF